MGKRWPGMGRLRAERKAAAQHAAAQAAAAVRAQEVVSDLLDPRQREHGTTLFERLHPEPLDVSDHSGTTNPRRRVRHRADRRRRLPEALVTERPCAARGHHRGCECADYVWEPLHA